jgi:hypothetical protein
MFAPNRTAIVQAVSCLWPCDDPMLRISNYLKHADRLLGLDRDPSLGILANTLFTVQGDLEHLILYLGRNNDMEIIEEDIQAKRAQIINSPSLSSLFKD